jgi:PHP family Zn ribbon phosphoesterase
VLDCALSYQGITGCIKKNDPKSFLYTIEFFPEEGKYHMDGHRDCKICLHPRESLAKKLKCPSCHRPLTLGVMHRVEALADRPWDYKAPAGSVGQKNIIPLEEIIADAFDCGVNTQKVRKTFLDIVSRAKNEFYVLLEAPESLLREVCPTKVADGILRMRRGDVKIAPGYDGEFGKISIFRKIERSFEPKGQVQMRLL